MAYLAVPDDYSLDSVFDTYILAFCPDADFWFVTNQRFFYYEYPKEFPDEKSAIDFFKENPKIFLDLEKEMNAYRFFVGGVCLRLNNTKELVMIED